MKINTIAFSLILTGFTYSSYAVEINNEVKSNVLEQITVTATRTQSPLQQLTSNISVVSQEEMSLIGQQHINQTMVRVPGAWISRGNGQEHLTAIRSPVLTGAGGCGAFYMSQDGISLRAPGFCNANQLFDVNTEQAKRIEVLRGPASTLYGSNAVHGVINVITPDSFEKEPTIVGVTFGANDYAKADFSVGTIGKKNAFRVYGNASHDGGYKDDSGYEQQKLNVIHQYEDDALTIKNVIAMTNLNQETAGFIQGENAYQDGSVKRDNPNPEAFRDSKSFRAYSQISFALDEESTLSITPYFRWTEMAFLQHFLPWKSLEENKQSGFGFKSQYEKQFNQLTWLAGIDVDITDGELQESQAESFSPTIPQGEHYNYDVRAKVYSPFTTLQWQVSNDLSLTAGMRYEYTEYDYNNRLSDGSACEVGVSNCRFMRPEDQKIDFDEMSYQIGVSYQLGKQHRLYSKYSTGYRAPQATELFRLQAGQTVADLSPEQLDSIEVGIRGSAENLSYEFNAFSMDKEHFIFQDANRQNISNGKTRHHGVEFSMRYQLPKGFYVRANGTVANHTYDNALTISRENIKGNEIDTAPQHMGSMQIGWRNENSTHAELEWVHLGKYYLNPENSAQYSGHNLLNLRTSKQLSKQWLLSARLLNITDEDYAERADFVFGNYRYFVGEPRSFYISAQYKFL